MASRVLVNRQERRALASANGAWGPWEEAFLPPVTEAQIEGFMRLSGKSRDEVLAVAETIRAGDVVQVNRVYQVNIRLTRSTKPGTWPDMIHLSIKRRDKQPVGTERFRDFQRIKNEIVGDDHEAVELYPAESRLADCANQYHLWVMKAVGVRFPFGFTERLVAGPELNDLTGACQKPFAESE